MRAWDLSIGENGKGLGTEEERVQGMYLSLILQSVEGRKSGVLTDLREGRE